MHDMSQVCSSTHWGLLAGVRAPQWMLEERILLDEKKKNNTVVAITTTLSGCDHLFIVPYICTVLKLIADGGIRRLERLPPVLSAEMVLEAETSHMMKMMRRAMMMRMMTMTMTMMITMTMTMTMTMITMVTIATSRPTTRPCPRRRPRPRPHPRHRHQ